MAGTLAAVDGAWKKFWIEHAKSTVFEHPQCQVLRTLSGQPISEVLFRRILRDIEEKLEIHCDDEVLDLCCGNGLITQHLASRCKRVVAVDFAPELVAQIDLGEHPNISVIVEDILRVDFQEHSFDKVIIYAGVQYLSHRETVCLFDSVMRWLKRYGIFYVGDIPDRERIWGFFNTDERERAHFDSIKNDKPIVGTWFDSEWLLKLGRYANFESIEILQQSADLPYSHYRFDMALRKPR
jgi:SAM-dependent methyltransferase